ALRVLHVAHRPQGDGARKREVRGIEIGEAGEGEDALRLVVDVGGPVAGEAPSGTAVVGELLTAIEGGPTYQHVPVRLGAEAQVVDAGADAVEDEPLVEVDLRPLAAR